ncbi:high mobility group nucleosome-binding domain-containing protein 5-like [Heterocephalus glaber]|uniref:High mobility group nucleosome-binding domain-containing protein 5-like n=1 Tax=Heterocephalus glaber TaxID=10181 RepID=A0AAX6RD75_HETGA|nr:high mobility group nucleosome-binding domain-containing protein 5-like [Heterocephalus glaber]XP_021094283.1 high mobility group nucleosome-binding domain-containing protein 5-like [Heterocephalus glaber]
MATLNPSNDCSDSEQSHLKMNSMESHAGSDLPASHTFHKETKAPSKGCICCRETTTFYDGCVVGSSVNNLPMIEEPDDTQTLGRYMDNKYSIEDNPNHVCTPSTDVEGNEDTDSDSEGTGADQIVTANDLQINMNSTYRGQQIDPTDGWPESQLVILEPPEKRKKDRNNEENKEESEYQEANKQVENCENQAEGMLMQSTEQEKKDTEKQNTKETQSNEEVYAELHEQIQVYERPDNTMLPDSHEDDRKEQNENHKEKEEIQNNEEYQEPGK